jgi:hypothetical protein
MKIRITNYTFNKTAKTVTFTDYTSISLDGVLLVTNVTDNIIIYNFANPALGGTVLNNVLTLDYDTSAMDNGDALQIFYDDGVDTLALLEQHIDADGRASRQLMQLLKPLSITTNGSGRLNIDVANVTGNVAQVTLVPTVTTVGTINDQLRIGGLNALDMQFNMAHAAWNTGIRNNITF